MPVMFMMGASGGEAYASSSVTEIILSQNAAYASIAEAKIGNLYIKGSASNITLTLPSTVSLSADLKAYSIGFFE